VEEKSLSRRSFFKFAAAAVAVVPFIATVAKSFAADACPTTAPAGKQVASTTEGMGKTLQYVTDAKTSKNAKYKAGAKCGTCKFYNAAKAEGGYAPCTMMGMKYVTNCGWCSSFAVKA
jgi:secreted PhoX family phosphatase